LFACSCFILNKKNETIDTALTEDTEDTSRSHEEHTKLIEQRLLDIELEHSNVVDVIKNDVKDHGGILRFFQTDALCCETSASAALDEEGTEVRIQKDNKLLRFTYVVRCLDRNRMDGLGHSVHVRTKQSAKRSPFGLLRRILF
jgi:hypothetical protein